MLEKQRDMARTGADAEMCCQADSGTHLHTKNCTENWKASLEQKNKSMFYSYVFNSLVYHQYLPDPKSLEDTVESSVTKL